MMLMHHFWKNAVQPVFEIVRPSSVLEIGAAQGKQTNLVAEYCRENGATLHVIDPAPRFDVESLIQQGDVAVYTDLSLRVLSDLPPMDAVLVDGDHNWYTVINELRILQQKARDLGLLTPVILCHDVAWPYGRRDLYYDPETVPKEFRHPWARKGMVQGQSALVAEGGRNSGLPNATSEGGPRNGVLTAIEDFLVECNEPISLTILPEQYGLGILIPASREEAHAGLSAHVRQIAARSLEKARRPKAGGRQLIPREIHSVWVGPNPIPEAFEYYLETWSRHHPKWTINIWRDETVSEILSRPEYAGKVEESNFKLRYDIARMEILAQHGGVIIDMDMEAIRPLDPLLPGITAFVGITKAPRRLGNQILGAVPLHPFFALAAERIRESVGEALNSSKKAGPAFLTRLLLDYPSDVTVFPRETFFSSLNMRAPQKPDDFPGIYAVHHHLESYRPIEARHERYQIRLHEAQNELAELYVGEGHLTKQLRKAEDRSRRAEERVRELEEQERVANEERQQLLRRLDAAESRLARLDKRASQSPKRGRA
jgi:Methyltransferase domain/Glycosyltransferase sugar-binding region containing DXD motif